MTKPKAPPAARNKRQPATAESDHVTDDGTSLPAVESVLAEFGGPDRFVEIYRQDERNARRAVLLGVLQWPDFSLREVKSQFGGGLYRFRIGEQQAGKAPLYHREARAEIGGAPRDPEAAPPAAPAAPAPAPAFLTTNAGAALVAALSPIVAALLGKLFERGPDPLDAATKLVALVSTGKPAGADTRDVIALVEEARKDGIEIGKAMSRGGGGEDDGLTRLAEQVGGPLARVLEKRADAEANAINARAARVAGTIAPAANVHASWTSQLRPVLPTLLRWARGRKDPARKVDDVCDDLPAAMLEAIAEQAEDESFVPDVLAAVPEFAAPDVAPWFTEFLTLLQAKLTDEIEADVPDAGERKAAQ